MSGTGGVKESGKNLKYGMPRLFNISMQPHFCPGCHYGIILRAFMEALEETDVVGQTILVTGIGCSMVSAHYVRGIEGMVALHGRAPAVATGMKRALGKDKLIFTMQGDGDLSAIGMGEIIAAASRAERLTTIFLNNANFGTTGGQMAPTSLVGQVTPTTPFGRKGEGDGFPIHMAELLSSLKGVVYSFRGAVNSHKNYNRTRKALVTAIHKQRADKGYSFVEILSACPQGQHIRPKDGLAFVENTLAVEFPLGEFKNVDRAG
jgi:2-oxoglutarate ferredoxin oxidoreductase subunit beta